MTRLFSAVAWASSSAQTRDASESGVSTKTIAFAASIPAQTVARQSDAPPRMSSTSIQTSLPRPSSAIVEAPFDEVRVAPRIRDEDVGP